MALRTDPISSSGGGVSPASIGAVHAELGARLPQRALGARERQRQLLRVQPDERVARAHFAADLDEHLRTMPAASALTRAWSGDSSVPARSTWRWTAMRCTVVVLMATAGPPRRFCVAAGCPQPASERGTGGNERRRTGRTVGNVKKSHGSV